MNPPKNKQNQLKGLFPVETSTERQPISNDSTGDSSHLNQYYALMSDGNIARKFQLILRSGKRYRVPYALLPITEISDQNDEIRLHAFQLNITIQGRGLLPIEESLSAETLIWVRESFSNKDDGLFPVFVSSICIEGEAIAA